MMIMAELRIALAVLFYSFIGISDQRALKGVCKEAFLDEVNASKQGYCWKFNPFNERTEDAITACRMVGGHLVTIDSKAKAKALSKFIKDSIVLTTKGYFGEGIRHHYKRIYQRKGADGLPFVLISRVYTGRKGKKSKWTATSDVVQWKAFGGRVRRRPRRGQTRCAVFSYRTKFWEFIKSCDGKSPSVCEQDFDTTGQNGKTTTPKPTSSTTQGSTTTMKTTKESQRHETTTTPSTTTTTTTTELATQTSEDTEDYPVYYETDDEDNYLFT